MFLLDFNIALPSVENEKKESLQIPKPKLKASYRTAIDASDVVKSFTFTSS